MNAFDLNPTHSRADSLAVGALAVVAGATANQDRIYVGSGEGPGGAYFGVGPIVSIDGGQNWMTEVQSAPGSPQLAGSAFYALAVDPADAAASRGGNPAGTLQTRAERGRWIPLGAESHHRPPARPGQRVWS